jgi:phosphoribosyl 1,2-cyclic phosphodiesterase
MKSLKITTYGTRGSIPVSSPETALYGGNTTCLRVESPCIPEGKALIIDAGSGYVPLAFRLLAEKVKSVHIVETHHHHDHNQGLLLAPPTFIKGIRTHLYGPVDASGIGPKEVLQAIMLPPFFPVHSELHESHFSFYPFKFPQTLVFLIHPEGGIRTMKVVDYEKLLDKGSHFPCGKGKYPKEEFLVIRMFMSNHPESTISYRFEEGPTGKVFVFLTDHENMDANPADLKRHLNNADLLIMDSQYTRERYERETAGYGHATPDYCVRTALQVGAKRLGLTHHDPKSRDCDIEAIVVEAKAYLAKRKLEDDIDYELEIFACADYGEYSC